MSSPEGSPQLKVGKYEILGRIGQGAMGVVYRARDPIMERIVAVKTMSTDLDAAPEMRARFLREARSAGQLSHKNIITIFELGEEDRRAYMVMEYVEGEDLKTRIARGQRMSLEDKLRLVTEIAEGLAHAHHKQVIHRDIKPGNIYITASGMVKILDFGLAHVAASDITKTGSVLGTPNYMSPEQVRGDRIDHRSDLFATGALFYELLTGRKPFSSPTLHATLLKILEEDPEPVGDLDPTLPAELTSIVSRLLAKEPAERYQQADELIKDLDRVRRALSERLTRLQDEAREAVNRLDLFIKEHQEALRAQRAQQEKADETVPGSSEFPGDYLGILEVRDRARRKYDELRLVAQKHQSAAQSLAEAARLEKRGDLEGAVALAAGVLVELPYHAEAGALARRLDEVIARRTREEEIRRETASLLEEAKDLQRKGALAESLVRIDRVLALAPENAAAAVLQRKVATALEGQKRADEEHSRVQQAANEKRQRADEALARARQAEADEDWKGAVEAARATLAARSDDPDARQVLDRAEARLRARKEREDLERRAASLLSEAEKLAATGDYTAAASVLRRADPSVTGVRKALEHYQQSSRVQHEARAAARRDRSLSAASEETVIVPRAAPVPRPVAVAEVKPSATSRRVSPPPGGATAMYAVAATVIVGLVAAGIFIARKAPAPGATVVATPAPPGPSPVPTASAPIANQSAPPVSDTKTVSKDEEALAEATRLLEARSFAEAAQAARAVLAESPGNDEAAALEKRAQAALDTIAEGRRRVRASLASGKPEEAAAALLEVLKLAPNDPEAHKLSTDLDRYARKQAEGALGRLQEARARAQQARPELSPETLETARRLETEGQRLFGSQQFSRAATTLGEAADAYGRTETEARAEAERQRVEAERQKAEVERQRALAAQRSPPSPAVDEAAQRQAEEARRAQEAARQDRQAIPVLIQKYRASLEARDIDALKAIWPTAPEKQLRQSFEFVRSWRVDLQSTDIQIAGDTATVACQRRDEMVATDGTRIPPKSSTARFSLRKRAGSWIIEGIQ